MSRSQVKYEFKDDITHLRVVDVFPERIRYLHFEESIQGEMYLDQYREPVLEYIAIMIAGMNVWLERPTRICLGGLGSASIFHKSQELWGKFARVDVVENDDHVIQVAREYFRFPDTKDVIHSDFRDFCESTLRNYDAVFVDCYSATSIPPHLMTFEFMSSLKRILRPDGLISFNLWSAEGNSIWKEQLKTIYNCFESTAFIQCPKDKNLVVFASNRALQVPDAPVMWKGRSYPVRMLRPARNNYFVSILDHTKVITDDNLSELLELHAITL